MRWVHIYVVFFILCTAFLVFIQGWSFNLTETYKIEEGYVITWGDKLYFVSWALWAACASTGVREFYRFYRDSKFVFFVILDFVMFLAYGNLADELFFDPTKFEWLEYTGAVVGLLIVAYRIYRHLKK